MIWAKHYRTIRPQFVKYFGEMWVENSAKDFGGLYQ